MSSQDDFGVREEIPGQGLAIAAEALFLLNLLALPGLAFAILAGLWFYHRQRAPALARQHLRQAFIVSLWGGVLILVFGGAIVLAGGLHEQWTWVVLILYFTCIHSTLILLGMVALVKAMGGQAWRYPLIGPSLDVAA